MTTTFIPSTRWSSPLIVAMALLLCALPYSIYKYPNLHSSPKDITIDVCIGLILVGLMLVFKYGISITYDDETFRMTDYFFLKKTVRIKNITEISYPPTFVVSNLQRMLTATIKIKGVEKRIQVMPYPVYSRQNIAQFVRDMLRVNPDIVLDE